MAKLKPCPFCGGKAKVRLADMMQFSHRGGEQYYFIDCEHGCVERFGYTRKEATEAWNTRATTTPITCKECNKRHTIACALWFSSCNDTAYFCERGDDFSCSWAEPRIKRLTKGHLDGLSAKITIIDELHEVKNREEDG